MTDRSEPSRTKPSAPTAPPSATGSPSAEPPPPVAINEAEIAALRSKRPAGELPVRPIQAPAAGGSAAPVIGGERRASESQKIRVQTLERMLPPRVTHKAHPQADTEEQVSDRGLVLRSMDGDNAAFEELYHRYLNRAILAAYAVVGQREKAQDVAQEAFIVAANKLSDLLEPEVFGGWVCGISRRMAIVAIRKESRRLNAIRDHQDELREKPRHDEPDAAAEKDEQKALIRRAIAMVPPNYREILLAKYVEKLSYDEIASGFGISRAAVDKRLTRGKQIMRKIMEDLMGEGGGLR